MKRHVRTAHSQAAQQRTKEAPELNRLELLHGDQIPSLSEEQTSGAVENQLAIRPKTQMAGYRVGGKLFEDDRAIPRLGECKSW